MSDEPILGKYQIAELLAVTWNDDMAARFPNANHTMCRQEMDVRVDGCHPFDPPHCVGWHCNRCGAPTNAWGHHDCPDRPEAES